MPDQSAIQGNSEKTGVIFPGFATGKESMSPFAKRLEKTKQVAPDPQVITLHEQLADPEKASEALGNAWSGYTHSLGELAIKERWPERIVFIMNPPTQKTALELIVGGWSTFFNVARGAVKGTEDKRYRSLLLGGLKETTGHPLATIAMGRRGINYDAIGRLADNYSFLSASERPSVHVIVSDREPMFTYDEAFEDEVKRAGFILHRVDCGHNAPFTKPKRVLEVIERELD